MNPLRTLLAFLYLFAASLIATPEANAFSVENRVGDFLLEALDYAEENASQVVELHREKQPVHYDSASEYAVAAKNARVWTKAELDKAYPRVTPRKGLRDSVWERSKAPDGKVYDPSGREIKPGEPWELGHRPGDQFRDAQRRAADQGWDRGTWRDYQNDPDIYRPEIPSTNRGRQYENTY